MWHLPSAETVHAASSKVKLHSSRIKLSCFVEIDAAVHVCRNGLLGSAWTECRGGGCLTAHGLSSNLYVLQTFLQTGLAHYKQAETQVFEHLKGGLPARRQVNKTPPAMLSIDLKVAVCASERGVTPCPPCVSHIEAAELLS